MNYKEVIFNLTNVDDFVPDVLVAQLGSVGFESFMKENNQLLSYCPENVFSEIKMQKALQLFPILTEIPYSIKDIYEQNWNEEWEQNSFEPIIIANKCVIHSSKKKVENFEIDIVIDPCSTFGTASHETTQLLISQMIKMDIAGKTILDMGCGTGILSILAAKLHAAEIVAIDIEQSAYENTIHNAQLNNIHNIVASKGDAATLKLYNYEFDIILANINRNILLRDMPFYCAKLKQGGEILFSGFFTKDIELIEKTAHTHSLQKISEKSLNDWALITFKKL